MKKYKCIFIVIIFMLLISINAMANDVIFYTSLMNNGESDKDKVFYLPKEGSFNRTYEFLMNCSSESINRKNYEIVLLALDNFKQIELNINNVPSYKHYITIEPNKLVQLSLSIDHFKMVGMHDVQLIYFFGSDAQEEDKWEFRLINPFDINRLTFIVDNSKKIPFYKTNYYQGQPTTFNGLSVLISKSVQDQLWSEKEWPYLEIIERGQEELDFFIHLCNGQNKISNMKIALICLVDWIQVPMNEQDVLFVSLPSGNQVSIPVSIPVKMTEKQHSNLVILAIASPLESVFITGTNFDNGEINAATQIFDCSPRILLLKE